MNMRLFISYCRDVTLSAGCLIDDRDSGGVYNGQCIYRLPVNITK